MRIMLFDMWAGGHNARYFDRFSTALAGHDVVVVAPQQIRHDMAIRHATFVPLPRARSAPVYGRPEESWDASITEEIGLIGRLVDEFRPDLLVHLFADHLVDRAGELARMVDTALLVLFPSEHYGEAFGSRLTEAETGRARELSGSVAAFRATAGARCVFTLDPAAASAWGAGPGAPAVWLPEPWIEGRSPARDAPREDIVFFGALAHRKGFDLLARAMLHRPPDARLVVAGWVEQDGYDVELRADVDRLRRAGVPVDLRLDALDERECLDVLGAARVAVLPYRRHFGMSRVFLEAVHCRTPVVVNDFGLLAHLVTAEHLGIAVDVRQPAEFAAALPKAMDLCADSGFQRRCREFSRRFSPDTFSAQLHRGLGGRS